MCVCVLREAKHKKELNYTSQNSWRKGHLESFSFIINLLVTNVLLNRFQGQVNEHGRSNLDRLCDKDFCKSNIFVDCEQG